MIEAAIAEGVQAFAIGSIRTSGTQSRKKLDAKTVADIREDIKGGNNPMEPIVLFFDGSYYWIGDGYHRLEAHVKEKRDIIRADIRRGSKEEALRFNVETNSEADQTRWTNPDKRNAVTMLLQSIGFEEVTRKMAEEIAAMAKCHTDTVYTIAKELRESARIPSKPTIPAQATVAKEVTTKNVPDDKDDEREEESPTAKPEPKPERKQSAPAGRRSTEMAERDEKIAKLAAEGCNQADISRRLGVSTATVSDSFRRQKLTPETANPLVKVLERAQSAAAEWEDMVSSLRDGLGAAALWPTATREQKKEVIGHIKKAIEFQTSFINRLNKEAKG